MTLPEDPNSKASIESRVRIAMWNAESGTEALAANLDSSSPRKEVIENLEDIFTSPTSPRTPERLLAELEIVIGFDAAICVSNAYASATTGILWGAATAINLRQALDLIVARKYPLADPSTNWNVEDCI